MHVCMQCVRCHIYIVCVCKLDIHVHVTCPRKVNSTLLYTLYMYLDLLFSAIIYRVVIFVWKVIHCIKCTHVHVILYIYIYMYHEQLLVQLALIIVHVVAERSERLNRCNCIKILAIAASFDVHVH